MYFSHSRNKYVQHKPRARHCVRLWLDSKVLRLFGHSIKIHSVDFIAEMQMLEVSLD